MNTENHIEQLDNVVLSPDKNSVVIIDQTLLPNKLVYITLFKAEDLYDAIVKLRVRGAPAIGIFAGFASYVLAKQIVTEDYEIFSQTFFKNTAYLNSARPTAVNLDWALRRMDGVVKANSQKNISEILLLLERESLAIREEDIAMCTAISENGLKVLKDGDSILTHCNTGPLATSRYGTAIGPILLGHERGLDLKVFADETRPLLQGARLTAFELQKAGVDVTLICDNMASLVMKNGWVQACFVGCDRVAANGDTANKIGTSGVAILARHYGIPFYVLGPTSTIDLGCPTGNEIEIELRGAEEIREKFYLEPQAPPEVKCYNPAFDVTDHSLITGIITEKGICYPPYSKSLPVLFD